METAKAESSSGVSPALALALVAAVFAANGVVGQNFSPAPTHPRIRRWYNRLEKPAFTPPGPVFALAWTSIELGLSYGGYRLLRRRSSPQRNRALALWGLNMASIGGWSALFFGGKAVGASALASTAMIGTATGLAVTAAKVDRTAALTTVPFIAWLCFATALAEEVWRRND